jgi:hypothetical protein
MLHPATIRMLFEFPMFRSESSAISGSCLPQPVEMATDESITPLKISANALSAFDTKGLDWDGLRKQSVLPGGFGDERVSIWYVSWNYRCAAGLICSYRPRLLGVNPRPDSKMCMSIPTIQITAPSPSTPFPLSSLSRPPSFSRPPSPPPTPHRDEHQVHLDTQRSFVFYPVGEPPSLMLLRSLIN